MLRMAVVIDYQNMHLTGANIFMPDQPLTESLLDPLQLATQIAKAKNATLPPEKHVEVSNIHVFRGQPTAEHNPTGYRLTEEEKQQWETTSNGIVKVTLRPLKYTRINLPDGTTKEIAQEKGIDVLCALTLVRLAQSGNYDVVVLASRDTDLAPALDEANRHSQAKIEAVKWYDPTQKHTHGRIKTETTVWTTNLTREHHTQSLHTPTIK